MGTGRGGVEVSTNYEWGGKDPKGVTTFKEQRPNWDLPIHDLMVKHKVSILYRYLVWPGFSEDDPMELKESLAQKKISNIFHYL